MSSAQPTGRGASSAATLLREVRSLSRRLDLGRRSSELDRRPAFPWAEFKALGSARLLGLATPRAVGGRGARLSASMKALGELAYHGGTTFAKLSMQPEFCGVLAEAGSAAQRTSWLTPLLAGRRLIGNHVTEPSAGSDLSALTSVAEPVQGGYRISGTKSQAAFAVDADAAIVYAQTPRDRAARDGRATAFLVPQTAGGIVRRTVPDMGERWMRRGTVRYEEVRVPSTARIGAEGRGLVYLAQELTRDRLLLSAVYLGVARSSFDETVRYAGTRTAFGRPIARHEAVGHALAEDWARLAAASAFVERTAAHCEAGEPVEGEAAMAKWLATETSLEVLDHAIQFHGGAGYSSALPHEQRWRDVRSGRIAHGTSEIMHHVATRSLWPRERPPRAPTRRTG